MSEPSEQFEATLKGRGYSLTSARRVVFDALQDEEPLSMNELVSRIGRQVDRASIYRTVGLFERLGIVQRLQIGWKYKLELTDTFVHHHHHLSCVNCGRIIALHEDEALEAKLRALAASKQFLPQDHQLEIRGLCKTCQ